MAYYLIKLGLGLYDYYIFGNFIYIYIYIIYLWFLKHDDWNLEEDTKALQLLQVNFFSYFFCVHHYYIICLIFHILLLLVVFAFDFCCMLTKLINQYRGLITKNNFAC